MRAINKLMISTIELKICIMHIMLVAFKLAQDCVVLVLHPNILKLALVKFLNLFKY